MLPTAKTDEKLNARTANDRILIAVFENQFALLHSRLCLLIEATPPEVLYRDPRQSKALTACSVGEDVLRSAAAIEQTFGGITASLWDDPFEWTLPENLSTTSRVIEYLNEVEATRQRAFEKFARDSDLLKEVLVPDGKTQPLVALLARTLAKAADYQGRASAILRLFSDTAIADSGI
jgi:hypothetical protein